MPDTILDAALAKITGAPAGCEVSSSGTAAPGTASVVDLVPKQSFANFFSGYGTAATPTQTQPGFQTQEQIDQQASLASAKARLMLPSSNSPL